MTRRLSTRMGSAGAPRRSIYHRTPTIAKLSTLRWWQSLSWLVRRLSSVRVAMALLLTIAVMVLIGTIVVQVPPGIKADGQAYEKWLTAARGKYGSWTGLFDRLQLFDLFHSAAFRALLALLALSIVVCTLRRWRGIWKTTFHARVRISESFLLHTGFHAEMRVSRSASEAAERLCRSLSRAHYRVRTERHGDSIAVFADKNRLSRFGTLFTHLSLILILAGAIAGGVWGFTDPHFVVAEGSTRSLGLGTDLSVRLDRSVDEYYPDGRPKQLRSDLTLLESGRQVKQGSVLVNAPMRYHGVAFHQSFYGPAAMIRVQDGSGRVLFDDGVPLALRTNDGQRPVGSFDLPEQNVSIYVTGPTLGVADSLIQPGQMRIELFQNYVRVARAQNLSLGTPMQIQGLSFTFEREARFSGLKVVKDPGTNLIWVAGACMVLGMVMLFYLPPRRLWALCKERGDGTCAVLLGMPAQRDISLSGEFKKLQQRLLQALGDHPQNQGDEHV